ncbi:DNA polymerase Y family protein [Sphingomonas sp. ZT3P38]|uniref:Y-family DNA polymerase n=1 Tax=Parasphingomonas zepuensis TaxID=3096161 RepID=UPI002FCB2681
MKRVASLYLPDWPIDRLRQAERTAAPPETAKASLDPLGRIAQEEQRLQCSVPRGGGWRPGARWAKAEIEAEIARLPAHQRPPMRELGRRSEAADHPFRAMRPDDSSPPARAAGVRPALLSPPAELPPLITSIRDGSKNLVAATSHAAHLLGIRAGMAVTQARAQVPDLDIRPADPAGDLADLERLALTAARRWSPIVALSGEDGLFIELTGTAHLFGGEERMARRIVRLLARLGVRARIAIADTTGAAWALARFGHQPRNGITICPPGAQDAAIAPLPIAALRAELGAIELLKRLGVETIGQLCAMPRAPLARRFGKLLVLRLDQAGGRIGEPLHPVVPPEPLAVIQRFAEPIATAEAIQHWLALLMPRLVTVLAQAGMGARAIELVADRIDGVPQRLRIGLARPSRDAAHLLRLIVRRIEEIAPGYGIDALALHVRRADPLAPQPIEERLEETPPDIAPLVDTLANRIGDARLWRSRPVESDVPERSVEAAPPLDPPERAAAALKPGDVRQLDRTPDLHPWHHRWPRPARLLRRPELLDHVIAELPDQPPRRFTWRGITHKVVCADGPERVLGEWWKRASEQHSVRDYFRVEDEAGQRFWLFRRGDGERPETGDLAWFMHGAFG